MPNNTNAEDMPAPTSRDAATTPAPLTPELAIVIPVCNEAQNLPALLRDWQPIFISIGVPYRIILIDDGSTDGSLDLLRSMQQSDPTLSVFTQKNAGHGPAILKGYHLATGPAATNQAAATIPPAATNPATTDPNQPEWIFQIDSDHQLDTAAFIRLWANRKDYDLLIARRADRKASKGRRWISRVSTYMVRVLYGKGVTDVNSPYRLMRSSLLRLALRKIPAGSFAPNILLTSWFILGKRRIFTTVVDLRSDGLRQSRLNRYFLGGSIRSSIQTILFRIK